MKTKTLLFAMLLCSVTFFSSCSKDETVKGCTDPDAENYNPDAEVSDGSCEFVGSIVFWYDQANAQALVADGAVALTYYLDGQLIGSNAASVYFTGEPNCGQSATISKDVDLGFAKTKIVSYSIKDQTGWEYYSGTTDLQANTCIKFRLY